MVKNKRLLTSTEVAELLGVKRQTVINWLGKGVLTSHTAGHQKLIDRESIEKLFDSLQDLDAMERRIEQARQDILNEQDLLDRKFSDVRKASVMMEQNLIPRLSKEILLMIIEVSKSILSKEEYEALKMAANSKNLDFIAESLDYTRTGIIVLLTRAIEKLNGHDAFTKLLKEHEMLKLENQQLSLRLKASQHRDRPYTAHPEASVETLRSLATRRIDEFHLTIRTKNALKKNGIKTIGELVTLREVELMDLHAIGKYTLDEVNQLLIDLGLTWQMDLSQIL